MATKVSALDAEHDEVGRVQVIRYVRREPPGGIGVGVSSFGPLPSGVDPRSVWEAHDVPEVHYILSGRGALLEEDEELELAAGDVVVTMPGRRHVLWGVGEEPLVTLYVAAGPTG